MKKRVLPLAVGCLLLLPGCGGKDGPTGPDYETLAVATTSLSHAAPTVRYSATLTATGGNGIYTWSLLAGSAPTWLTLNESNGELSGTPEAAGTENFTVEVASGDGQTATQQLTITVDALCSDLPGTAIASFEDANLEALIRAELSLAAQDDLTCGAISGIDILFALSAGIESLMGVQNLTGLSALYLRDNSITDISAVSGLTDLGILVLGVNSISDITPLSGLGANLWDLDVGNNPLSDISTLSALTGMTKLYVNVTPVSDISALVGLTALGDLDLADNPNLTNIDALLNNAGIGMGDQVFLERTGVDCMDVAVLVARGVIMISDC